MINLYKRHSNPSLLDHHADIHTMNPYFAWEHGGKTGEWLEDALAKDAKYAYRYAQQILHRPFKLGEPVIAKNAETAVAYAQYVLKGRFKLGESTISKDAYYSFNYAIDILHSRFKLGEPAIKADGAWAKHYNNIFGTNL